MLGFVNGRSCAHKSKPRGLVLCFNISGAKVRKNFPKIEENFPKIKNAPDFFRNRVQNYCFFLK